MSTATALNDLKSVHGLTRTLAERGPQLLAGVLIIALALECALIVTRVLSGPETPPPAAPIPLTAAAPHGSTNPQLLLANIVNAHLFGAAAGATGGANAPPTTMSLILAGVIADNDPSKGQAIIGESAAAAKLYSVNGVIPGGARLHAVYSDRVLLERNGALETLALPRNALRGATTSVARPAPAPTATALRENPSLLAGLVRVQPVFTQGKMSGYRIFPGGPSGTTAFNQLGLRPGDLIVAVNGTTLEDPARAMEVLQTLSSSGSATVTVSRNGVDQEVNLNLATLNSLGTGTDNAAAAEPASGEPPGPLGPRRRLGAPLGPGQPADADQRSAPTPPAPLPGRVTGEVDR